MKGKDSHTEVTEVAEGLATPWVRCALQLPPLETVVETKIDDMNGCRNAGVKLQLFRGLWWFSDMSMYVYYSPTHWRPLPSESSEKSAVVSS